MVDEDEMEQPAPQRKGIKRGIYILPSAFTIGNVFCGFYAVIQALKGYQVLDDTAAAAHFFDNAAKAIGYGALLDSLDGRIARMTKTTSEFGVEMDSIADVLTFGIAPALLMYTWGYGSTQGFERLAWGASFFFLICGALRLARFNVMARAPRFKVEGNTPKLDKRYFVGLPIPMAACLPAAVVHFIPEPLISYSVYDTRMGSIAVLVGMSLLSVLMVSTLKYTSFKNIGGKSVKPFFTLPFIAFIIALVWFYSQWTLLILTIAYVSHGIILKLWSIINRLRHIGSNPKTQSS